MIENGTLWWFDRITASVWFALALTGVIARVRRTTLLRQIRLEPPVDPDDQDYLTNARRASYLRLLVKSVFLLGSLLALSGHVSRDPIWVFFLWRLGVILTLACLLFETVSTDLVRARLGRTSSVESG